MHPPDLPTTEWRHQRVFGGKSARSGVAAAPSSCHERMHALTHSRIRMTYFANNVCATRAARATATDPGEAYPGLLPNLDETGYASHFPVDHPRNDLNGQFSDVFRRPEGGLRRAMRHARQPRPKRV